MIVCNSSDFFDLFSARRKIFILSSFLRHFYCLLSQRFTRAPAPPMIASTSAQLAMEVSPGVVIARAP